MEVNYENCKRQRNNEAPAHIPRDRGCAHGRDPHRARGCAHEYACSCVHARGCGFPQFCSHWDRAS